MKWVTMSKTKNQMIHDVGDIQFQYTVEVKDGKGFVDGRYEPDGYFDVSVKACSDHDSFDKHLFTESVNTPWSEIQMRIEKDCDMRVGAITSPIPVTVLRPVYYEIKFDYDPLSDKDVWEQAIDSFMEKFSLPPEASPSDDFCESISLSSGIDDVVWTDCDIAAKKAIICNKEAN